MSRMKEVHVDASARTVTVGGGCKLGERPEGPEALLVANSGSFEVVAALLASGASADVAHGGNGVTPLHAAAAAGHAQIVRALIDANANVDRPE